MNKFITCCIILLFNLTNVNAQFEWKERADFYDVFSDVFLSAQVGDFRPVVERCEEMLTKYLIFAKSISGKFDKTNKEMKRNEVLLSEHVTFVVHVIRANQYTNESLYGALVVLHNKYRKILLKGEASPLSKSLTKYYENEEKEYLKKKKKGLISSGTNNTAKKETTNPGSLKKAFVRINGVGENNLIVEIEANVSYVSRKEASGIKGVYEWKRYIKKYEGIRFRYPNTSNKWFPFSGGEEFGTCKNETGTNYFISCVTIGGMAFKLNNPQYY